MGSSTKNFVSGLLLLSLLLCGWSLVQPTAAASQDSAEGAILDQALKEAAQELGTIEKRTGAGSEATSAQATLNPGI